MSSVSLWTRFDPFDALVRRTFGPVTTWSTGTPGFVPAAEINRDGDDAVVRVELPGVDPATDVEVEVDRGRLVVRGQRRDERTESGNGRSLREVRYGAFRRSFQLPEHVTAEAIRASYDAGVLAIRVAGAYTGTSSRKIEITAGGTATPAGDTPVAGETPPVGDTPAAGDTPVVEAPTV
jgi:HSP20 family molecular chaperone IbpA